jgi:hypothetical protein
MNSLLARLGSKLARRLAQPRHLHGTSAAAPISRLAALLRPADILLVEGTSRVSSAIKFLTQSSWSHAALYVGDHMASGGGKPGHLFVEADMVEGVRGVGFEPFAGLQWRICRPVGLSARDARELTGYCISRIGQRYDLRNVIDLARYLIPTPPVPLRWRRRMISLGSGDPTRAICSTLIAKAFESIRYPILPMVERVSVDTIDCPGCVAELLHIRHHSLFTPRDFDMSPYFEVIKPTAVDFDHRVVRWAQPTGDLSGASA